MTAAAKDHAYPMLDGMRGVAAIAVLTWHAGVEWHVVPWFCSAYLAVDVFFMLSGFVLAHAYEHRFAAGMTTWQFMRARLIRLYPLYVLGTGMVAVSVLAAAHTSLAPAVPWALAFLPTPPAVAAGGYLFPLNAPAWSLSFELLINLAFVVSWRWLSNRVLGTVVVIGACATAFAAFWHGALDAGFEWNTAWIAAARTLFAFPLGVLLYRSSHRVRIPRLPPTLLLAALGMVLLPWIADDWLPYYDLAIVVVASPAIIFVASVARPSERMRHLCTLLGDISYPMYVLQWFFIFALRGSSSKGFSSAWGHEAMIALLVITMTAISLLAYNHYDLTVRSLLHHYLIRSPMRSAAAPSPPRSYHSTSSH